MCRYTTGRPQLISAGTCLGQALPATVVMSRDGSTTTDMAEPVVTDDREIPFGRH